MAVTDLQAWADYAEAVRLPDIESDIAILQTDLSSTETLLNAKILEFTNNITANAVAISANQTDIVAAQGTANTAVSQIYQVDLDATLYTDAEINALRTELLAEITSRVGIAQTSIEAKVDTDISAVTPTLTAAVNQGVSDAQAARDQALAATAATDSAILSMLTVDLPTLQGEVDANTLTSGNATNDLTILKTGYGFTSLVQGFDDIIGTQIPAQIATFEAEFRDPISGQIKNTALTAYSTTATATAYVNQEIATVNTTIANLDISTEGSIQDVVDNTLPTLIDAEIAAFYDGPSGQIKAAALTNYYTIAQADSAITLQIDNFEAEFRDPVNGQIKATALTSYYTQAQTDSAISAAQTTLQSSIDAVTSDLATNYYTIAQVDGEISTAVSAAQTTLQANIDAVSTNLTTNYFTSAQVTGEISSAVGVAQTTLQSNIDALSSDLDVNYYTKTETDGQISTSVSSAQTVLQAGIDAVEADLATNYYTEAEVDSGISTAVGAAQTTLQTNIDAVNTNLLNNYYTSVQTDGEISTAVGSAQTVLQASIDGVASDLSTNYMTSAQTNSAISSSVSAAQTTLQSNIDGVVSDLALNYFTKTETTGEITTAVSAAQTTLQSNIDAVAADLSTNFLTSVQTNAAIAAADTALKAAIEDPLGSSVGGDLAQNYYTSAETDSEISTAVTSAQTTLQANIDTLSSDLALNYFTKVQTQGEISTAVSVAETSLQSDIDAVAADLAINHYTKSETDGEISTAVSASQTTLQSGIDAVEANLNTNYYTNTQTDTEISTAVSAAQTTLQAGIDTVSAELSTNYRTTSLTDVAIASASTSLKAEIEDPNGTSLGATVDTQATAIANLEGNAASGYLIKAQVGDVASLLELVAADGGGETISLARLSAAEILLEGTVFADFLSVDYLSALSAYLGAVTVTELMRMPNTTSAFMAGKTSASDYTQQGFFMGRLDRGEVTAGSFEVDRQYQIASVGTTDFTLIGSPDNNVGTSFLASGVGTGTGTAKLVGHSLNLTSVDDQGRLSGVVSEDGKNISILNPKFYTGGQATGSTQDFINTGNTNLGVNTSVDIEAIAGGGSGGWGLGDGSSTGNGPSGTNTQFSLRIGSPTGTIIKSWDLYGGLGGSNASEHPSTGGGKQGESSPFGEGGTPGGNVNSESDMRPGGDGIGAGSAGGGASADWHSLFDSTGNGGGGGFAGQYVSETVDTTAAGSQDVYLVIDQIGQGASNPGGTADGGKGADGLIRVSAALAGMKELTLENELWNHQDTTPVNTSEAAINAGDVDVMVGTIPTDMIGKYLYEIEFSVSTDASNGYSWAHTIALVVDDVEVESWYYSQDDSVNTRTFSKKGFVDIAVSGGTVAIRWKQSGSTRIARAEALYMDCALTGPYVEKI